MPKITEFYRIFVVLYTVGLVYLMLFGFGRLPSDIKQVEYIPFKTIFGFLFFQYGFYYFFINIVCNIVLFIPYGMLGLLFPRLAVLKWNLFYFLIVLILMEFLQYITGRGTADIDDLILNALGVMIGNYFFNSVFFLRIQNWFRKVKG